MKRLLSPAAALLAFIAAVTTRAADLTLTDGRIFQHATIVSQAPRTVVIKHADGLSGIDKLLLPAELSQRYPIDEPAALEAERLAAEARARSVEFHKAEAERVARLRLEREQSALHNAQIAALEASQRLAEVEAAHIASQRSETVYGYAAYPFSPYYSHAFGPSYSSDCAPRSNEKARNNRLVRDDCTPRYERNSNPHQSRPVQKLNNPATVQHGHKHLNVPRISQAQPPEEERKTARIAGTTVRR